MPFVKLDPTKWPQDDLVIPRGLGAMPPIEAGNKDVVGAEFFSLAADFTFLHTLAGGQLQPQTQILATPQDGDFWCDQIAIISWATFAAQVTRNVIQYMDGQITIRDVRTGKSLISSPLFPTPNVTLPGFLIPKNSLPIGFFRKFPPSGVEGDLLYSGNVPPPTGFRDTGTMIQPFCFTRQGGIEVVMQNSNGPPGGTGSPIDFTLTICFGGWKEYANASH